MPSAQNNLQKIVILCVVIIAGLVGYIVFQGSSATDDRVRSSDSTVQSPGQVSDVSDPVPPIDNPNATKPQSAVGSFEDCVAAGNPVMESYPRQCIHDGEHFVESIAIDPIPVDPLPPGRATMCQDDERNSICTRQYDPVCAEVQVQCITSPCPPIQQTFGNACEACSNPNVQSHVAGECPNN